MVEDETRELEERGFCVLRSALATSLVDDCRDAFWPVLSAYLATSPEPNRGPARHFLPMPFDPPCFSPGFFFHEDLLRVVHEVMGDRVVADQWGCDVPLLGSRHQNLHRDYARPLFAEAPELALPPCGSRPGLMIASEACGQRSRPVHRERRISAS